MTLTVSSNVFRCSIEEATFVAECANLRDEYIADDKYKLWQDRQTGGGGCRIVWCRDIAWVSRHSGYAYADITWEVCEFFTEIGCEPIADGLSAWRCNPHMYPA